MGRRPWAIVLLLFGALAPAEPGTAARPLATGFLDPVTFESAVTQVAAFDRARAAGTTTVRLALHWVSAAPQTRPPDFDPSDPADPAYNWSWFDGQVRLARAHGLEPVVPITIAPKWATATGTDHITKPDPAELAAFATAAARRYSGDFTPPGETTLPRIRYWQVWNEPNRDYFLLPQYGPDGRIVSAGWYRRMVRSMGTAVRAVDPSNRVVGGSLAAKARKNKPSPLGFMRTLLCLSPELRRTCDLRHTPVRLDVWSHHPYTPGSPTHRSPGGGDVLISGLPKMRRVLQAAVRLGQIAPRGPIGFWVTEFGWDTNPPDPQGVPSELHARWTSEALFRIWKAGVSLVTWWRVQDDPLTLSPYQSGLYTVTGARKPSLTAFRFPTVGFRTSGGLRIWGRTPFGEPGTVGVLLRRQGAWRRIDKLRTSAHGVYRTTYRIPYSGSAVMARFNGETSLAFSLTPVRDRAVKPFGCGGAVPCG